MERLRGWIIAGTIGVLVIAVGLFLNLFTFNTQPAEPETSTAAIVQVYDVA